MSESPIEQLLAAVDGRDPEALMALMTPASRVLAADGRRAEGTVAVRDLVTSFLDSQRSSTHRITDQWHVDNVWIAEVDASYELQDRLHLDNLPRVFVLREAPDGIADLRVYGAHEQPLTYGTGTEGIVVGGHLVPPL